MFNEARRKKREKEIERQLKGRETKKVNPKPPKPLPHLPAKATESPRMHSLSPPLHSDSHPRSPVISSPTMSPPTSPPLGKGPASPDADFVGNMVSEVCCNIFLCIFTYKLQVHVGSLREMRKKRAQFSFFGILRKESKSKLRIKLNSEWMNEWKMTEKR